MKLVYTNENQFIVSNLKNLIEAQGIDVFIKNEFAQGAVGEIAAIDSWPEIWVLNDSDVEAALQVVKISQKNHSAYDWICNNCLEKNDPSFEICWNCQHENT